MLEGLGLEVSSSITKATTIQDVLLPGTPTHLRDSPIPWN